MQVVADRSGDHAPHGDAQDVARRRHGHDTGDATGWSELLNPRVAGHQGHAHRRAQAQDDGLRESGGRHAHQRQGAQEHDRSADSGFPQAPDTQARAHEADQGRGDPHGSVDRTGESRRAVGRVNSRQRRLSRAEDDADPHDGEENGKEIAHRRPGGGAAQRAPVAIGSRPVRPRTADAPVGQQPRDEQSLAEQGQSPERHDRPPGSQEDDEAPGGDGPDDEARLVGRRLPAHADADDPQGADGRAAGARDGGPHGTRDRSRLRIGHAHDGAGHQDDPVGQRTTQRAPDGDQRGHLDHKCAGGDPPGARAIVQTTDERRPECGSQTDGGDHGARERQAPPRGGDDEEQAELVHGGRKTAQVGADEEAGPGRVQKGAHGGLRGRRGVGRSGGGEGCAG